MAAEMPDLSHLTAAEREIIESVVHRQKQEEQKEQEIMRWVFHSVCNTRIIGIDRRFGIGVGWGGLWVLG